MDPQRIAHLFQRYEDGQINPTEREELYALLRSFENNDEILAWLEGSYLKTTPQPVNIEQWQPALEHIVQQRKDYPGQFQKEIDSLREETRLKKHEVGRFNRIGTFARVAAIFILVIGLASLVFLFTGVDNKATFATDFGKIDTIMLPDNSTIVLNANSNIQYSKKWKKDEPRELWLEGEAYFDIKHLNVNGLVKPYDRFIVHVKNTTIEVLGTRFNVRERRGKTEIVLEQGRIKISFEKRFKDVIMKPGQMLTIDSNYRVASLMVNPEEYTTWKNKKLLLKDASLLQITEYLEDIFGKDIVFSDPALGNRIVEGTFKLDNLDDAILFLTKALNLDVVQEGDKIFITPK